MKRTSKLPPMPRASSTKESISALTDTLDEAFWEEKAIAQRFGEPTWNPSAGERYTPVDKPASTPQKPKPTSPKPAPQKPKAATQKAEKPVMPSIGSLGGALPQILTLTGRDQFILRLLGSHRRLTLQQIAEAVAASQNRPAEDIQRIAEGLRRGAVQKLKEQGLIKRITPGKYAASSPFFVLTAEAVAAYPPALWQGEEALLDEAFQIHDLDLVDHSRLIAANGAAISLASGNMTLRHWDPRLKALKEVTGVKYPILPAHRLAMARKDMTAKGIGTAEVQKKAMASWLASPFPSQSARAWDFFSPLEESVRKEVEQGLITNFSVEEHVATPPAFLFSSLAEEEIISFIIGRPNISSDGRIYTGQAAARFDDDLSESKEEKRMLLWRLFTSPAQFSQLVWITGQPEIETRVWEAWLSLIAEGRVKQEDISWLAFGTYKQAAK